MRDIFITLLAVGSLPVTLRWPHVGVLVWAWLSLASPHRLSWGFAYDLPFVQLSAIATLGAWLFSRERKAFPVTATTVLLMLFTFWVCVTTVFALSPELAQERLIFVLKILALAYVALIVINTRERIHALVWMIVISLGFYGFKGGLFTVLSGASYRIYGPPGTFIEDNNHLGLALIMVLPLFRYLQVASAHKWLRWAVGGLMATTLLAIFASYSRGALLGLSAMLLFVVLMSRRKALLGVLVAATVGVALLMLPQAWYDRMSTIGDSVEQQDASAQGRLEIWTFAFRVALARPLVGGGFEIFEEASAYDRYAPGITMRAPHSIIFQVLGEHGFVGLGLFLALCASAWIKGFHIRRRARGRPELQWAYELAGMVQAGLVGYGVAGLFLNLAFFDLIYLIIVVMVATGVLVDRATATAPARLPAAAAPARG